VIFRILRGTTLMRMNLQPMRSTAFRHSPLGLGLLARNLDATQTRAWIDPCLSDPEIREDAVRFLKAIDPKDLLRVSTRMKTVDVPALVVWGMADRAFKPALGRRLAEAFDNAQFIEVPGARTFVQLDEPKFLADQITNFLGASHDARENHRYVQGDPDADA
jgi:pimeloyl-ACP methyl ester carboxylesterase